MRKVVLAVVLCLLFAVPVYATQNTRLYINSQPQDAEVILKDGRAYVPLRLVSEKLGAEVRWDGQAAWVDTTKKKLVRPAIKGSLAFKQVVNEALDMLEEKDLPHYAMVCENTKEITDNNWMGIKVLASSMDGVITITEYLKNDDKRFTPEYLAGVIAHEATHLLYQNNGIYDYGDSTKELEDIAFKNSALALKLVKAPGWAIEESTNWERYYDY